MTDIFESTILCENCNQKTSKGFIIKEGFQIRKWECNSCNKIWYHPLDMEEYKNFQKIKNRTFEVKLRMVGNSYTISIPREIIEFEREMQERMNEMINLCLEEPEKLTLYFNKKVKRMLER